MAAEAHSRIIAIINTVPRVTTATGYGAVTATLLTPASTVSADSSNYVAILPTGNAIRLYVGGVRQLTSVVYGPASTTQNNLTCAVNSSTGAITLTQATNWTATTQEIFSLTATYNSIVYTVLYTVTKAISGTSGSEGWSYYDLEVFKQSQLVPVNPSGGNYTFTGDILVTPSGGYTRAMPTSSTIPIWRSNYLFKTKTPDVPVYAAGTLAVTNLCDQYYYTGPTNDPYWANVVLMLHMDGANGGATFTDSSSYTRTVTRNGTPTTSTTGPKFGTAAALFSASTQYLTVADSADLRLDTGDFTLEVWVRLSSKGVSRVILNKAAGTSYYPYQLWYDTATDTFRFRGFTSGLAFTDLVDVFGAKAVDTYYHIAATRSGNTFNLFLNGALQASGGMSGALYSAADLVSIGAYSTGAGGVDGYLDDLRITKGIARYTENFNIPISAFPDAQEAPNTSISNALLLNFNGTNGSAVFTDSSPNAAIPTVFGGAVLTTDPTKRTFGTAAGDFSASANTYIRFAASTALQLTGAFTIKLTWIPLSTGLSSRFFFGMSGGNHIWLKTDGSGFIACHCQGVEPSSTIAPQAGTKYHIVITKTSTGLKQWWINGAPQPSMNTDVGGMSVATFCEIGACPTLSGGGVGHPGYIDGLQIINGYADINVFPPTEEFAEPHLYWAEPPRTVLSIHAE